MNEPDVSYEKEIKKLFSSMHEDWMDDEDKDAFDSEMLKLMGGIDKVNRDIRTGVENGFTVEFQLNLLKRAIRVS